MARPLYTISKDAIRELAISMGLDLDEPAWEFLLKETSCEVFAAPGSGKTTLLILKLLAIARTWSQSSRGILVLSHTNVARSQVDSRLAMHPQASRLLRHPHFIGTFQTFVDRFVALPHLRDVGPPGCSRFAPENIIIDDNVFRARVRQRLCDPKYRTANNWCRAGEGNRLKLADELTFKCNDSGEISTNYAGLPSEKSPTTQALKEVKRELSAEGVFRYHDMFALAKHALIQNPRRAEAIRRRFPLVFIDETQDNGDHVEELVKLLFTKACDVQRLGDPNQAIFSAGAPESATAARSISKSCGIDLRFSHRFDHHIALTATTLTTRAAQKIQGRSSDQELHSVILFDDRCIGEVLPVYGGLVLATWGDDACRKNVTAIASRIRHNDVQSTRIAPASRREKLPYSAADYWHSFLPRQRSQRIHCETLWDAIHAAHSHATMSDGGRRVYTICIDAMRDMHRRADGSSISPQKLLQILTTEQMNNFRHACVQAARGQRRDSFNTLRQLSETIWKSTPKLRDYLKLPEPLTEEEGAKDQPTGSVFVHQHEGRTVSIRIESIHAVKGETHDATLVLETYQRTHDLKRAVQFLLEKKSPLDLEAAESRRIRNLFVAATRPRSLLCFAMRRDHLKNNEEDGLRSRGWNIIDLTRRNQATNPPPPSP